MSVCTEEDYTQTWTRDHNQDLGGYMCTTAFLYTTKKLFIIFTIH